MMVSLSLRVLMMVGSRVRLQSLRLFKALREAFAHVVKSLMMTRANQCTTGRLMLKKSAW